VSDGEDSTLTAAWIRRVITRLKANGLTAELAEIERLQQTSNLPVLSWWRSWAGDLGAGAGIGSHAAMAGTNPQGRAWRAVRATIKTLQAEDRTAALAGEEPQPAPDSLEATLVPLGPPPEAAPGPAKEDDLPARLNNATEADLDACILHYAALSPDKKISRVQLRRQPAVAWVAAERKAITNKTAVEDRLRQPLHASLRRGPGERANPSARRE
jgi:hypothetical protein